MFKTIDLNQATTEEIIEAIRVNNLESDRIRNENYALKKITEDIRENQEEFNESVEPKESTSSDDYIELLIEAEMLEEQLSQLETTDKLEENIHELLKTTNYSDKVIMRVIANYHKKVIDTSRALKELIGEMSVDEILATRKEITAYKEMKKALLKAYKEKNKSSFILVPNEDGSIKMFLSMKKLAPEQNTLLLGLLNKISLDTTSSDISYAGDDKFGVIYARLDQEHIALIDLVFNGRKDNKIINHYRRSKNTLQNLLTNQSFLSEQDNYVAKIYITLGDERPKQHKKVN